MKKKLLATIMALSMILSLSACGAQKDASITESSVDPQTSSVSKETVTKTTVDVSENKSKETIVQEGLVTEAPEKYEYSIVITINPQITLYMEYNEKGEAVVKHFKFDNEDAKDAYGELELVNLKSDDAVKLIIKTAAEKEYLKDDGDVTIDIQPVGDELPLDITNSYKEVASATVNELNKSGNVVIHNYDLEGKEIVETDEETSKKEVKAEDKKETAKTDKKKDTKTSTSADTKKTEAKTNTPASTPVNTPEPTPTPTPNPAPAVKKVCNGDNHCDNPDPAWGEETWDTQTPYDVREDRSSDHYVILHCVRLTNGHIRCKNCGGSMSYLDDSRVVSEENWYYECDADAYNAARSNAYADYRSHNPHSETIDTGTLDESGNPIIIRNPEYDAYDEGASAYVDSAVNEMDYYRWVQH